MITKATLVALMMTFPTWREYDQGETKEARQERFETIVAPAMIQASEEVIWSRGKDQMILALVTEGYFESRFARFVHNGECLKKKGYCDNGRAISIWQLQKGQGQTREEWLGLGHMTLDSTTKAAKEAAKRFANSYSTCKLSLNGAFSLYATGNSCSWSRAKVRVRTMERLESKVRAL